MLTVHLGHLVTENMENTSIITIIILLLLIIIIIKNVKRRMTFVYRLP